MNEEQDLITYMIEKSISAGAEIAEVIKTESKALSVAIRLNKVENVKNAESSTLGLRIIIDNKQSLVATSDFSKAMLDNLIDRAIIMARSAPENPYIDIASANLLSADQKDLLLYDNTVRDLSLLTDVALETEEAALSVSGVTNSNGAKVSHSTSKFIMANSNHNSIYGYSSSANSIFASVVAGTGADMQNDYYYSTARFAIDLESPRSIGIKAAELARNRMFPRKIATTKLPVVFAPRVANTILTNFATSINGAVIANGASFLKNKLGQQIFASNINIIDDPWRIKGLNSRPFDDEVVTNSPMHLVRDGVLTNWLLDLSSAKKLGMISNGRAERSVSSLPAPAYSNLFFQEGIKTPLELIAGINYGFYVTDLFSTGINIITGDYSQGAAGFAIENGMITYPVNEVTIASNLTDMFHTLSLANDLEFRYGANSPTILIPSMMLAGV